MADSHWMIVISPENYHITKEMGFTLLGLQKQHRRKAERMALNDRILYFISRERVFAATCSVTSPYFEDHTPIWKSWDGKEDYPYRVNTRPVVVLQEDEYVDAYQIAPRMMYVKRWPPEQWPLAFHGQVHLLSRQDFRLIEHEMERIAQARNSRPERSHSGKAWLSMPEQARTAR